jgi:hypothetical protein
VLEEKEREEEEEKEEENENMTAKGWKKPWKRVTIYINYLNNTPDECQLTL